MRRRLVLGFLVWAVVTAVAFLLLDPILAAAVTIVVGVVVALVITAADWDQHSTYEHREMERARRRREKWARRADVRARDRARWEAHQARQAGKPGNAENAGTDGPA